MIGQTLSHFRIVEWIGSGGMGDVYLVRDTELNRDVALKVLPAEATASEEQRERFKREARAVAALNHPNIVTVHSVEQADGFHFITMELVRGKTVRELLPADGFPLERFLEIALPLVDAVDAAHRHGITHRDLKPANIMVSEDGRVKVLDFGLAKARVVEEIDTEQATMARTQEGRIVGTPHYMSPEQAEGRSLDHRSDIFSLGTVLYEMITGEKPFHGGTPLSVLSAIVKDTPRSASEIHAAVPARLGRILEHALAKDPEQRYQSASELHGALNELRSGATAVGGGRRAGIGSLPPRIAGALGVATAAACVYLLWSVFAEPPRSPAPLAGVFTQMTTQPGREHYPSLSPDGEFIVYTGGSSTQNTDIYRRRIDGETTFNLTEESVDNDTQAAFSPDGAHIAFRSDRDGGGIFVMGATGESVARLTDFGYYPDWSPDGRQVVFASSSFFAPQSSRPPSELWKADVASGETKLLAGADAIQPSWSPNGDRIAFWSISDDGRRDVWTIAGDGGTPTPVTQDDSVDWSPKWSHDGEYLIFSSDRGGSMNLWRVPIDEASGEPLAQPEPVTTPATYAGYVSVSRDGSRWVYMSAYGTANLESIAFDALEGRVEGSRISITEGSNYVDYFDTSPADDSIVFTTASPHQDVFVMNRDGTGRRRLTEDAFQARAVSWSPDGRRIAFSSNRSGANGIWTIDPNGRGSELLVETAGATTSLAWSPDGNRIAYCVQSEGSYVFEPGAAEAAPIAVGRRRAGDPRFKATSWRPDGSGLAGTWQTGKSERGLAIYEFATEEFAEVADIGRDPLWLHDGRRLIYWERDKLFLLDVESGQHRELLTRPNTLGLQALALSRDNRTIYFSPAVVESDIWLLTLEATP